MIPEFKLVIDGIDKSKQLLVLAEAGEWEQFLELEHQRQSLLSGLSLENIGLTGAQYAEVQTKMAELIDLNDQLEAICRQQRSELAKQIQKISHGNKATKAYSE
jgi:flagellar protein FliT